MIRTIFTLLVLAGIWMFFTSNLTKDDIKSYQQKAIDINEKFKEAYHAAASEAMQNTNNIAPPEAKEDRNDIRPETEMEPTTNKKDAEMPLNDQLLEKRFVSKFVKDEEEDLFTNDDLRDVMAVLDEAQAYLRNSAPASSKKRSEVQESEVIKKKSYNGQIESE